MSRVDYCVTTMERPRALERLLLSIARHQPDAAVHVADQSERFDPAGHERLAERLEQAGLRRRPTVHRLPFDWGVSAARNHLAEESEADYKLILDDDFEFTAATDIDAMERLLDAQPRAGVVGGRVIRSGRVRNYDTRFERSGATLRQLPVDDPFDEHDGIRFRRVGCVPVFLLMRKELCVLVRWDPRLKTAGEHLDFFLRVGETEYEVLHAPDITVDHPPAEGDARYRGLRRRGELLKLMMRKHGLTRLEAVSGAVFEIDANGKLHRRLPTESANPSPAAQSRSGPAESALPRGEP